MREYGGYLPLELNKGKEYYQDDKCILRLNSGRSAIAVAMRQSGWKKLYIPFYMCLSVIEMCEQRGIEYELYHINSAFEPMNIELNKNEAILIPNYFGMFSSERQKRLVDKYQNVIIDNTQSFFSKPYEKAYNVYSCRKFIGVADGAYLIHAQVSNEDIPQDIPDGNDLYLLDSIDNGTNASYSKYLQNEKRIEDADIKLMSESTRKILQSADYDSIKQQRINNYEIISGELDSINQLKIVRKNVPMVYPLLLTDKNMRKYLVDHKIYVPQWWKWILDTGKGNDFENMLAEFLFPLPIDQRYGKQDMFYISNIVKKEVGNGRL